jgi:O-antigen/teichoic acid export membrane protein
MFIETIKHISRRGLIIAINQISVLLAIPILAARLDFEVFGQVAIGFVLVQLSWAVSDWGVQHFSIEEWGKKVKQKEKNHFITSIICLNFLISLICLLVIFLLAYFHVVEFSFFYFICLIPSIIMGGSYPLWFFQVNKSPQDMILPTFFSRIIFLSIIYFYVLTNDSAFMAFLAQGINLTLITLYSFYRLKTQYKFNWSPINFFEVLSIEKRSRPFLLNAIINNQANTLWGFGLSIIGGPASMAIFNLGDQIYRAGGAMTNIIAQSVRIHFIGKSFYDLRVTIFFFVVLFCLITASISSSADFLISNFFPQEYLPATQIIQVMMIAWGLHALVKLLNYPVLGEKFGSVWVNSLTYKILFIHIIMFAIWCYFFSNPLTMAILFTSVILIQLIIFLIHILR